MLERDITVEFFKCIFIPSTSIILETKQTFQQLKYPKSSNSDQRNSPDGSILRSVKGKICSSDYLGVFSPFKEHTQLIKSLKSTDLNIVQILGVVEHSRPFITSVLQSPSLAL